jgi:DNA-binding HxlR family transcriptional regulator
MALIIGLFSSTLGGPARYLSPARPDEQKLLWSYREMAHDEITAVGSNPPGCPLDPVLSLLALKWLVHIVWLLGRNEILRFAELQRQLPGDVSAKVLSARLKQLESHGIVEREDKGTSRPHVVYGLTTYGRAVNDLLTGIESRARQLALPGVPLASFLEEAKVTTNGG